MARNPFVALGFISHPARRHLIGDERTEVESCINVLHQCLCERDRLLAAQTMGESLNTPDFLDWLADRLVNQYGESPTVDFVRSLRERAAAGRAAVKEARRA